MEVVRFEGKVRRSDFLTKPVWFSQSEEFNGKREFQLNNRKIEVEYKYDILIQANRRITEKEKTQLQNAINSIIICNGDWVKKRDYIFERLICIETVIEFMQGGSLKVETLEKRYMLANGNDVGFVSEYEDLLNGGEKDLAL